MYSSQAAIDLIVASEVGSKAQYEAQYEHPEWPGGRSGVTIGIGYDLGFATRQGVQDDWGEFLPAEMIAALQSVVGLTGPAAHSSLASVRHIVSISWDAAMHVFERKDIPKWETLVDRACPGSRKLPTDCFGVLVSLAYNRGAGGFNASADRFREMHAIRQDIIAGTDENIPAQIRSMKRLWGSDQAGLLVRRDKEAKLFEAGLRKGVVVPITDDEPVTPTGNEAPTNVQPKTSKRDVQVEAVQANLVAMHYHEIGEIDGRWGGKTRGAIIAFLNDRGIPSDGLTNDAGFASVAAAAVVVAEVNKALEENWSRPIATSRANATAKDLANKVPSVNQTWWQKAWAVILGLPTAAVTAFKSIFGDQGDGIASYVTPVKDFFATIPTEVYLLAIVGIAVAVFVQAKRAQDATVRAYQRGEIN